MDAAAPLRSNLLRLEHELQTVMVGGALSRRDYSQCLRHLQYRTGNASHAGTAPRGRFQLPCSFRVSACLFVRPYQRAIAAGSDQKAASAKLPLLEAIAADVPDTLTGHNRNI